MNSGRGVYMKCPVGYIKLADSYKLFDFDSSACCMVTHLVLHTVDNIRYKSNSCLSIHICILAFTAYGQDECCFTSSCPLSHPSTLS